MKAEKEHIDELIVSYLSNELDGNAVHELKEWIAASVENEKYFMQRQEIWFSAISVKEDVKYDKRAKHLNNLKIELLIRG